MPIQHSINIRQRPVEGTSFLARYPVANYKHRITAVGGYDTASCEIAVTPHQAETLIEQYIGCAVNVYARNPGAPIWEGFISRMIWEYGNTVFTISLDEMVNRARSNYHAKVSGAMSTTSPGDNLTSQAIYGIKEAVIDSYTTSLSIANAGAHRNALRDALVSIASFPLISTSLKPNSGPPKFTIEMQGWWHTLEWEIWSSAATALATPLSLVTSVLGALSNGSTFFNASSLSEVVNHTAWQYNLNSINGMTAWQYLQSIQEPGDGITPWVMGIGPGATAADRKFYFRAQNRTVEYTSSIRRDAGRIRNVGLAHIDPWDVRPDRMVWYSDILPGWNLPGSDPRKSYIEVVNYDAESQQVTLQGDDSLTLEDALNLRKFYKKHNRRGMGAQVRQIQP